MDVALAAVVVAALVAQGLATDPGIGHVAALVVMGAAIAWRRAAPLPAALAVLAAMLAYPGGTDLALTLVPFAVTLYSLGAHRPVLPGAIVVVAAGVVLTVTDSEDITSVGQFAGNLLFYVLLGGALVGAGALVRASRSEADGLSERARELERQRDEEARRAVATERGRIARELHDVVAHAISVVSVQAGAARATLDRSPERADAALDHIEQAAQDAGAEMRRLLGLLRGDEDTAPLPSLDHLAPLLEHARRDGTNVRLEVQGERRTLPPGVDLAAYRIVQESLTNVRRHAAGAVAQVVVRYVPGAVEVAVVDDGGRGSGSGPLGSGHGLIGMRERVALYGGRLDAGPVDGAGRGFRVHAVLPTAPGDTTPG